MNPRQLAASLLLTASAALGGCVTEGPPIKPLPSSTIPPQPAEVAVNKVVFTVAQVLEDRDRNGYYDTISATVYLFDTRYPYSIHADGIFTFFLTDPETGKQFAKWSIPSAEAAKSQSVTWTGTIYPFQLDLREVGSDRIAISEALIACTFSEPGLKPVECGSRLTILVGKTR